MPKFPHIRQKDAMDYGPSCLAMVAAHCGCQLDLAVHYCQHTAFVKLIHGR